VKRWDGTRRAKYASEAFAESCARANSFAPSNRARARPRRHEALRGDADGMHLLPFALGGVMGPSRATRRGRHVRRARRATLRDQVRASRSR
jgi:hypothetical protein